MRKGFTLLELIVVIIILGILATLGYTQYSNQVESTRLAEAKARLGLMRELTHEYYLKNGTLTNLQDGDLGVDNTCTSDSYYRYWKWVYDPAWLHLRAYRCTSGGKTPNTTREYIFILVYTPSTGDFSWHCNYTDDNTSCFGLPP